MLSRTTLTLLAIPILALAQAPPCYDDCFGMEWGKGSTSCQIDDMTCNCENPTFDKNIASCIATSGTCGPTEIGPAGEYFVSQCEMATGVAPTTDSAATPSATGAAVMVEADITRTGKVLVGLFAAKLLLL